MRDDDERTADMVAVGEQRHSDTDAEQDTWAGNREPVVSVEQI